MEASQMKFSNKRILTINGGSSSIKFALFEITGSLQRVLSGTIERIGLPDAILRVNDLNQNESFSRLVVAPNHTMAVNVLVDWLHESTSISSLVAVGHRVVHGGPNYSDPQRITLEMINALRELSSFDPEHLPEEIMLSEAISHKFPELTQVACFDTAFHHNMPRVAQLLTIPRSYENQGLRRYGFHGLSYAYLMQELERISGAKVANGRIILAHLGSGASMAAVYKRRSLDTTMSFTPAAGLMMGTRSGDIDPGLVSFLCASEQMTSPQFNKMINHESGLLGVSETSSDMRDLLAIEAVDVRAAEALALFCYQARKQIGAYAAAMGGLETLVFAGGVGENAPEIRARICTGLEFLGIEIEEKLNAVNEGVISSANGQVVTRVMRTDEELMIARSVCQVLGINISTKVGKV